MLFSTPVDALDRRRWPPSCSDRLDEGRAATCRAAVGLPPQLSSMPAENRLLAGLPRDAYERLLSHIVRIPLARGHVLYQRGDQLRYGYFPMSGLVSLLATTEGDRRSKWR